MRKVELSVETGDSEKTVSMLNSVFSSAGRIWNRNARFTKITRYRRLARLQNPCCAHTPSIDILYARFSAGFQSAVFSPASTNRCWHIAQVTPNVTKRNDDRIDTGSMIDWTVPATTASRAMPPADHAGGAPVSSATADRQ